MRDGSGRACCERLAGGIERRALGLPVPPARSDLSTRAERSPGLTTPGARGTRALLLNFAIWTLIGAFQASSWVFSPSRVGSPQPGRLLAIAMINAYVWKK
jgi:hypothetical protein